MHPALGREAVERQELLLVAGDLGDDLGVLGAVGGGEVVDRLLGVITVLGAADRASALRAAGWADFGRQSSTFIALWTQSRWWRVSGNTSASAPQNPSAQSPTASTGRACPAAWHCAAGPPVSARTLYLITTGSVAGWSCWAAARRPRMRRSSCSVMR